MTTFRSLFLAGLMSLGLLPGFAVAGGPRQYYGPWEHVPGKHYYHRTYFFKPTANYVGYQKHVVTWFPAKPQYYYYYNPETQKYWGRGLVCSAGTCYELYSLLPESAQAATLAAIPEKAFPKLAATPRIPQTAVEKVTDKNAPQLRLPADEPPPAFLAQAR